MEWKQNHWDEQSKKKSTLHYHLPARILYWVMWLPKFYSPLQISQFRTKITTQQKRSSPDKSKYNPPQYKLWKSIVWQGLLVRKKEMKDKVNHIIFQGFRTRKSFVRPLRLPSAILLWLATNKLTKKAGFRWRRKRKSDFWWIAEQGSYTAFVVITNTTCRKWFAD